ncbi:MAG TPA: class I SAM-dependent methyltransferase [Chitinophagaceae bacterium]|nr:class I SAM-dependent methyltransferase [Chitinophagaceae bacterium]
MKNFRYISYFFYLSWHWNFGLAFFIIKHEIKGEKKYSIQTTGADELKHLGKNGIDISHATIYMPVNYYILEILMKEIRKLSSSEKILDLGCGKGRVMVVAAHFGFKKINGIDFSEKLCKEAIKNTAKVQSLFPETSFKIELQDAFYYKIPDDISVIFLFNPFDEVIVSGVLKNINESLQKKPRTLRILYANPVHKKMFTDDGFIEIFHHKKLKYLEGSILEKKAG